MGKVSKAQHGSVVFCGSMMRMWRVLGRFKDVLEVVSAYSLVGMMALRELRDVEEVPGMRRWL
jgi:hypothetical protein